MDTTQNILILSIWILAMGCILYLALELEERTDEYNALFQVYQDENNICKEQK